MADLKIQRVFELRPDVAAALHDHCCETGEDRADFVSDAVAPLLDATPAEFIADADAAEEAAEVTVEAVDAETAAAVDRILRLVP